MNFKLGLLQQEEISQINRIEVALDDMSYGSGGTLMGKNAEIGDMLSQFSRKVNKLERMIAKIGTKNDNFEYRQELKRERDEIKKLSQNLMASMKKNTSSSNRQVADRLRSQFDQELQNFFRVEKQMAEKEKQVVIRMDHEHEESRGNGDIRDQLVQQDMESQFAEYDVNEVRRRQEDIHQIERDILDVREMYKDFQNLVNEQQESIDIVESHIQATADKVEGAHEELLAAERHGNKARKKQCCMLFMVLGVVLAVVLVFTLK